MDETDKHYSGLMNKSPSVHPPQNKDQIQQQQMKKSRNRGSAVQLQLKSNVQLKLNALLS